MDYCLQVEKRYPKGIIIQYSKVNICMHTVELLYTTFYPLNPLALKLAFIFHIIVSMSLNKRSRVVIQYVDKKNTAAKKTVQIILE